jgi:hypothetical protein
MIETAVIFFSTIFYLSLIIIFLSLFYKKNDFFSKAPGIDLAIFSFTALPWVLAFNQASWLGLTSSLLGQLFTLYSFNLIHERLLNQKFKDRAKLYRTLNQIVGFTRNHLALLICLLALPIFLALRIGQILIYPMLRWTLRFPKYNDAEWINVSRYKFEGLVGHDLVWCLYCDWMTGLHSLTGEMLRNVESFWCPIRFYDGKKCDNCTLDFPDLDKWTASEAPLEDVQNLLLEKYPPDSKKDRTWFGYEKS